MTLFDERCPNSNFTLAQLRDRLIARSRHPCTDRFDRVYDIEDDFRNDLLKYRTLINLLINKFEHDHSATNFLVGLLIEGDDLQHAVFTAWRGQDVAMNHSFTQNVRAPVHPPSQTLLD